MTTDYRSFPPAEQELVEEPDETHTCSDCDKDLPFTYSVYIPSLCSHCLQGYSLPSGAEVHRNTNAMEEFVKPSPPGFHWSIDKQAHVPDNRVHVVPTKLSYGYGGVGGNGAGGGAGSSYSVGTPGGGGGGIYVPPPPPAKPTLDSTPGEVYAYIKAHYPAHEIQDRYSEIRNELLYPPPPPVIQGEWITDKSGEQLFADLTGREGPAILEDKNPETKEAPAVASVLSRSEAQAAFKEAAAALAMIEALEEKYSPDLPNGSVIAFRLQFPGQVGHYNYCAIRAVDKWFTSGKISASHAVGVGVDWSVLLEAFESYVCSDFEVLRTGGEAAALETIIPVTRIVTVPEGTDLSAFLNEPDDDDDEDLDDDDE